MAWPLPGFEKSNSVVELRDFPRLAVDQQLYAFVQFARTDYIAHFLLLLCENMVCIIHENAPTGQAEIARQREGVAGGRLLSARRSARQPGRRTSMSA